MTMPSDATVVNCPLTDDEVVSQVLAGELSLFETPRQVQPSAAARGERPFSLPRIPLPRGSLRSHSRCCLREDPRGGRTK